MRTRLTTCLSVLAVAAALAAQDQPQRESQATFRTGANYVRVDMYAMQDGTPVHDIRREEIEVLEDGVPQKVEDFEHVLVRAPGTQEVAAREPAGLAASREAAADPRARVFIIFLDTYHTQLEGSANVRQPLVRFLDRVLGPDDLVALMTPEMAGSDISLGRKTNVISNILSEEWWGRRARIFTDDPKETLYEMCGAKMRLSDEVVKEMIARRREKLTFDALEDLMVHLAGLRDERKAVVVVTEGWMLYQPNPALAAPNRDAGPARPPIGRPPVAPPSQRNPLDNPAADIECEADRNMLALVDHERRLREITDDANRGNVTFYPVHARGLVVFDSPIGPDYPPPSTVDSGNLRTRIDSMRALAVDTDGEALVNTNNLEGGLQRIADDLSSYYLLGYYSTNTKLDGRFRSITVRVKRPGIRVRARRGYRGRTAEELVSAAGTAADPAGDAVATALNRVAGLNARSMFRIRSSTWARADGASAVAGSVWIVGELDYRTRKELAWTAGAEAEVTLVGVDGTQLMKSTVAVPAAAAAFVLQIPDAGTLAPGDYAVNVRVRPESGSDLALTDTVRVTVPDRAAPLGDAIMWRRGPSTGPQYLRTADPRFQRSERLRLESATALDAVATARVLDRAGKPIAMPVQVTSRTDAASGIRWIIADATLAPLAAGDYAVEVTLGDTKQVTGFRIVP
jgi:VWFA-related protein